LPTPSDDAYVAALDDSLQTGSETLAEGQSGRSDNNLADSDVQVLNWVETDDPVFFITIDDGIVASPEVLEVVERYQIPVTAFLTEYAVRDKTDYFEAVTAYGGSVQNHTMVHGALDDPATDVEWEICETQDRFEQQFGYRPWMIRPPYGAGPKDPEVLKYAEACGINRIVLWNVVVTDDNQIEYWEPPIKAGDIVLLHWVEGMEVGLERILELGRAQGLTPAPLEDYI
jgi:peptidoglycan/xylan/chitin deacetylase (PgdA/CDA1 family)